MTQSQFIQRLKQQPKMGGIFDELSSKGQDGIDALAKLTTAFAGFTEANNTLAAGIVGINLGLDTQIGLNEKLAASTEKLAEKATYLERRNKEINKTFGVGSGKAAEYSAQFAKISVNLQASAVNIQKYGNTIRKDILPVSKKLVDSNSTYYTGLIKVQQVLTTNLGLSEEQASKYTLFTAQTGESTDVVLKRSMHLTEAIKKSTGLQFSFKDITEEVAKASSATQLQFGRMPGNLELAAIKAKSLGFSLDEMTKIGTQMLDIESSIGAELEYQLLSGNRLVDKVDKKSLTNKFREAALAGDASKQADALNTILNQEGDVLENNLLARQQMSKLLGMDEASLARALQKKKILEASGASSLFSLKGDELESAAAQLVKDGKMSAKSFRELMESNDTRTTTQKMSEQIDILNEQVIMDKLQYTQQNEILDIQKALLKVTDKDGVISQQMLNMSEKEMKVTGQVSTLMNSFAAITDLVTSVKSGTITGNTTVAKTTKDDFVMSPVGMPGYERVLSDGKDAYAINDLDYLIGMTNPTGGGSGGMDLAALANTIVTAMKTARFEVNVDPIATGMA